jgi:Tol biopolymer transport system component
VIGQTLGHYRVTAALGSGGMGEVYRASDSRLSREVAIKVLPAEVASDAERLARFRREAQVLAALNHPNVGAIYGLDEANGKPFLVLELVEGETLADRIEKGALPIPEALEIARQVADGLGAAHDKGIVHRDLKPANVKLTPDGQVKVLDFGLARAYAPEGASGSSASLSHSPTLAAQGTAAGMILGTAAYMSPEQARGKRVDKRADIWAFGVIVWEMLTGRRLFAGDTVSDVLAAVLRADLDWKALPPATPAAVDRLLRRCLERDPKARLHDIADARLEITDAAKPELAAAAAPTATPRRAVLPWALALSMAALAAALGVFVARDRAEREATVRFELLPPAGAEFQMMSIAPGPPVVSPDGRSLAFSAVRQGQTLLYVRALDSAEPRALGGTDGAQYPFWSPDSRAIGFFAQSKLKRVDAAGGAPFTLCDAPDGKGASWSTQKLILFTREPNAPLQQVAESGGTPSPVTQLDAARKEDSHRHPRFLPDGRRFLYLARVPGGSERGDNAVMAGSLDGGPHTLVLRSGTMAEYASGRLFYLRERTLVSQPFDLRRLALTGEPAPVTNDVRVIGTTGVGVFSASAGTLVYQVGQSPGVRKLVWRDRQGKALGTLAEPGRYLFQVALSPRGDTAVASILDTSTGNSDLWTIDLARGVRSRFTFDPRNDLSPVWSPDGQSVVFASNRELHPGLYRKALGGAGEEELLLELPEIAHPTGISPDGRVLVFARQAGGNWDTWALPLDGARTPVPLLQTPHMEVAATFSPDGRYLAYTSVETGRPEVYVIPYPATGRRWQVSTHGGAYPRWRRDGREIVYQTQDGTLTAAAVSTTGAFSVSGAATALFKTRVGQRHEYVWQPTADAQRFLVVESLEEEVPRPFSVTLGWQSLFPAR